MVPKISKSNIYHPWHPGPLNIIMLGTQNLYIYLIFTIPGIQGLYISSSLVPRISLSPYIYIYIYLSIYLIFTIPGIQGLYISSSLVPRISESNIYDESLYIYFLPSFTMPMYWFLLQPAAKDRSRSPIRPKAMPAGSAPSSSGTPVPEPVPHPKAPPEATPPAARAPLLLNQHIIFYHKCWVFPFCCFVFCTSRALMLASCLHTCPPSSIFFFPFEELTTLWDSTHGNYVQLGFSFNITFRCFYSFLWYCERCFSI